MNPMNPQIQAAILTALLAFCGAIIGYFLKEYQNRSKPFISLQRMNGKITKQTQYVKISKNDCKELASSIFITKLNEEDELSEVSKSSSDAEKINEYGKGFINLIDKVIDTIKNKDEDGFLSLISKLLSDRDYEYWIFRMTAAEHVNPPNIKEDLPIKIEIYDSEENDGCIWFSFPRGSTSFGKGFHKHPIIRAKADYFIKLIQLIDFEGLGNVFDQVKQLFGKELLIAKEFGTKLEEILNENSRWEIRLYVANLGRTPFLINNTASLEIFEESGAKFDEECYMVLLLKDKDGNPYLQDTLSPLVLGSEKDISFSFITKNVQQKMEKGKLLREVYNSGKSECRLSFSIEQVAFIRNKIIKTPKFKFKEII